MNSTNSKVDLTYIISDSIFMSFSACPTRSLASLCKTKRPSMRFSSGQSGKRYVRSQTTQSISVPRSAHWPYSTRGDRISSIIPTSTV